MFLNLHTRFCERSDAIQGQQVLMDLDRFVAMLLAKAMSILVLFIILFLAVFLSPVQAKGPINPETYGEHTLKYRGKSRNYLLYTPNVVWTTPLVIVLHGGGGNAKNAEEMTGFTEKAKKEQFAVVYPNGTGNMGDKLLTWNAKHCCGDAMRKQADDVGFISALIDHLVQQNKYIDPGRIYVTGISNGGMLTHRLGYELSDKVTAIAPVASGLFGDEPAPAKPVSAIMINGGRDKSIPLNGGVTAGRFANAWDGTALKPVMYQASYWSKANGCDKAPEQVSSGPEWKMHDFTCPDGVDVQHYVIPAGGHAWPGGKKGRRMGDEPSHALNATDVIWEFFQDKKRAPARKGR